MGLANTCFLSKSLHLSSFGATFEIFLELKRLSWELFNNFANTEHLRKHTAACSKQKQNKKQKEEGENKVGISPVRKFNNNYGRKSSHVQASQIICISTMRTQAYILKEKER